MSEKVPVLAIYAAKILLHRLFGSSLFPVSGNFHFLVSWGLLSQLSFGHLLSNFLNISLLTSLFLWILFFSLKSFTIILVKF